MTPGESLTPWVLLMEEESYLSSGPYLGQITSEKQVGAQNEKCPNRDMQNYLKSSKEPVTLHKTKVKQMNPCGWCLNFQHTDICQTFKRNFFHKKCFLLVNLFTPSFSITSESRHLWGKKLTHLTLNIFLIFDFITCSLRSRKKICDERSILDEQRLQSTACPINLTQFWYTNSGLDWTPGSAHPLREKLC